MKAAYTRVKRARGCAGKPGPEPVCNTPALVLRDPPIGRLLTQFAEDVAHVALTVCRLMFSRSAILSLMLVATCARTSSRKVSVSIGSPSRSGAALLRGEIPRACARPAPA